MSPLRAKPSQIHAFGLTLILSVIFLNGCRHEYIKPNPKVSAGCGNLTTVSFARQVQPIINANCVSCHDVSSGIKLNNYSNIVLFANSGQLVGALTGNPNYQQMPPTGNLDSCTIQTIENWVKQGKLNN